MKTKLIVFILILLMLLAGCEGTISRFSFPTDFKSSVLKYSEEYNLDPYIVYGIIKRESKFIHDAESGKGAKGLMQLTDATAEWTAEKTGHNKDFNLFDPKTNIKLGCAYFSHLIEVYGGNISLALCAYNAGMGNVNSWIGEGIITGENFDADAVPFEETRNYIKDVYSFSETYKELYPDLV